MGRGKGGSSGSQISFKTSEAKLNVSVWFYATVGSLVTTREGIGAFPFQGPTVFTIALTLQDGRMDLVDTQ